MPSYRLRAIFTYVLDGAISGWIRLAGVLTSQLVHVVRIQHWAHVKAIDSPGTDESTYFCSNIGKPRRISNTNMVQCGAG